MERVKNAVIFHGSGDGPSSYWIPYMRQGLELKGYQVRTPQLPNDSERLGLDLWLPEALKAPDVNTRLLIAHSAGVPLALSVLESLKDVTINQVILVAGFCSPRELDEWCDERNPILQASYDWDAIRARVGQVICLNSDDDPYTCDDRKGQEIVNLIGSDKARLIVMKGQGHMGSDFFQQPYKEFPFLLSLVG
ncbi:alpha/beta hydrolase [Candidatus Daviesbacteria bacterium]|nr:alpha/beta hydrolase [Candidatus Daviesbacteria bacterium]